MIFFSDDESNFDYRKIGNTESKIENKNRHNSATWELITIDILVYFYVLKSNFAEV